MIGERHRFSLSVAMHTLNTDSIRINGFSVSTEISTISILNTTSSPDLSLLLWSVLFPLLPKTLKLGQFPSRSQKDTYLLSKYISKLWCNLGLVHRL